MTSAYLYSHLQLNPIVNHSKVELTPAGFKFCEQIVGKGLFELGDPWAFYIINALKVNPIQLPIESR